MVWGPEDYLDNSARGGAPARKKVGRRADCLFPYRPIIFEGIARFESFRFAFQSCDT
jgi:hypothetical protein